MKERLIERKRDPPELRDLSGPGSPSCLPAIVGVWFRVKD